MERINRPSQHFASFTGAFTCLILGIAIAGCLQPSYRDYYDKPRYYYVPHATEAIEFSIFGRVITPSPFNLGFYTELKEMTKRDSEPPDPWQSRLSRVAFFIVALFLSLAGAKSLRHEDGGVRRLDYVLISFLVVVAGVPLLGLPLEDTGPIERMAHSVHRLFADLAHPFLPFLLNSPAVLLSTEPWVVRVVPFLILAVETLLLYHVATGFQGRLAGVLSAIWFTCEIRRRHGVVDLSDWDYGGLALLFLVAFFRRIGNSGKTDLRTFAKLAVLLVLSVTCSYLNAIAAIFALLLFFAEVRKAGSRLGARLLLFPITALVVAAVIFLQFYRIWALNLEGRDVVMLFRGFIVESPVGRSVLMVIPLAIGFIWLIGTSRDLSCRFALCVLVATPLTLLALSPWTRIQPYYIDSLTPLGLLSAANGTTWILRRLHQLRFSAFPSLGRLMSFVTVFATVCLTVWLPPVPQSLVDTQSGRENLNALDHLLQVVPAPIVSNIPNLQMLIAYERVRHGREKVTNIRYAARELGGELRVHARNGVIYLLCRNPLSCDDQVERLRSCLDKKPFYMVLVGRENADFVPPPLMVLERHCRGLFPLNAYYRIYWCEPLEDVEELLQYRQDGTAPTTTGMWPAPLFSQVSGSCGRERH